MVHRTLSPKLLAIVITISISVGATVAQAEKQRSTSTLKPAGKAAALRRVPDSADSNSNNKGGVRRAVAQSQTRPRTGGLIPNLVLTQHSQPSDQPKTSDDSDAKRSKKRPGLLRRIFGRFTVDEHEESANDSKIVPGAPAPHVPQPPSISYQTNDGRMNSVPAHTAGFAQQKASTTSNSGRSNSAQPLVQGNRPGTQNFQNQNVPTLNGQGGHISSRPRQQPRNDGFINPFVTQDVPPPQDDVLLDLDSLVEGRKPAAAPADGAFNRLPEEPATPDVELVPVLPVKETPVVESVKKPLPAATDGTPDGPFTGYRLESDEEVLGFRDEEHVTEVQPKAAPNVRTTEQPEAIATQSADTSNDSTDLKEPAMQLPPVERQPAEAFIISTPAAVEQQAPPSTVVEDRDPAPEPEPEKVPLLQPKEEPNPFETEETVITVESDPVGFQQPKETSKDPAALQVLDSRAKREQQRFRIMARTGKTGFKGFCPVTLRDKRELVDSREEFKAKFGLQTYFFSSPEAKSAFEANPSRYAPAAGGSDVVLLVNTGEEMTGALDFSLWYRDRLYLFRSRETQQLFSRDPARYANQY